MAMEAASRGGESRIPSSNESSSTMEARRKRQRAKGLLESEYGPAPGVPEDGFPLSQANPEGFPRGSADSSSDEEDSEEDDDDDSANSSSEDEVFGARAEGPHRSVFRVLPGLTSARQKARAKLTKIASKMKRDNTAEQQQISDRAPAVWRMLQFSQVMLRKLLGHLERRVNAIATIDGFPDNWSPNVAGDEVVEDWVAWGSHMGLTREESLAHRLEFRAGLEDALREVCALAPGQVKTGKTGDAALHPPDQEHVHVINGTLADSKRQGGGVGQDGYFYLVTNPREGIPLLPGQGPARLLSKGSVEEALEAGPETPHPALQQPGEEGSAGPGMGGVAAPMGASTAMTGRQLRALEIQRKTDPPSEETLGSPSHEEAQQAAPSMNISTKEVAPDEELQHTSGPWRDTGPIEVHSPTGAAHQGKAAVLTIAPPSALPSSLIAQERSPSTGGTAVGASQNIRLVPKASVPILPKGTMQDPIGGRVPSPKKAASRGGALGGGAKVAQPQSYHFTSVFSRFLKKAQQWGLSANMIDMMKSEPAEGLEVMMKSFKPRGGVRNVNKLFEAYLNGARRTLGYDTVWTGGTGVLMVSQPGAWCCQACGTSNLLIRITCSGKGGQCGQPRPVSARSTTGNTSPATPVPLAESPTALPSLQKGEWRCFVCMQRKSPEAEHCEKCNRPCKAGSRVDRTANAWQWTCHSGECGRVNSLSQGSCSKCRVFWRISATEAQTADRDGLPSWHPERPENQLRALEEAAADQCNHPDNAPNADEAQQEVWVLQSEISGQMDLPVSSPLRVMEKDDDAGATSLTVSRPRSKSAGQAGVPTLLPAIEEDSQGSVDSGSTGARMGAEASGGTAGTLPSSADHSVASRPKPSKASNPAVVQPSRAEGSPSISGKKASWAGPPGADDAAIARIAEPKSMTPKEITDETPPGISTPQGSGQPPTTPAVVRTLGAPLARRGMVRQQCPRITPGAVNSPVSVLVEESPDRSPVLTVLHKDGRKHLPNPIKAPPPKTAVGTIPTPAVLLSPYTPDPEGGDEGALPPAAISMSALLQLVFKKGRRSPCIICHPRPKHNPRITTMTDGSPCPCAYCSGKLETIVVWLTRNEFPAVLPWVRYLVADDYERLDGDVLLFQTCEAPAGAALPVHTLPTMLRWSAPYSRKEPHESHLYYAVDEETPANEGVLLQQVLQLQQDRGMVERQWILSPTQYPYCPTVNDLFQAHGRTTLSTVMEEDQEDAVGPRGASSSRRGRSDEGGAEAAGTHRPKRRRVRSGESFGKYAGDPSSDGSVLGPLRGSRFLRGRAVTSSFAELARGSEGQRDSSQPAAKRPPTPLPLDAGGPPPTRRRIARDWSDPPSPKFGGEKDSLPEPSNQANEVLEGDRTQMPGDDTGMGRYLMSRVPLASLSASSSTGGAESGGTLASDTGTPEEEENSELPSGGTDQ